MYHHTQPPSTFLALIKYKHERTLVDKYSVILDDFEVKMASSCKHFQQVEDFKTNYLSNFLSVHFYLYRNLYWSVTRSALTRRLSVVCKGFGSHPKLRHRERRKFYLLLLCHMRDIDSVRRENALAQTCAIHYHTQLALSD